MTMQQLTTPTTTSPPALPVAVATFAGTGVFTTLGTVLSGESGEHGWGELAFVLGVALVAVIGVFALVRRTQHSPRAAAVGLGLAVLGLATVLVFFMGLTPAFAVGGMVLGAAARRSQLRPGLGGAAIAVGALALIGYVAIYLSDLII
ncbi:MAG: hypothetical protein ACXWXO_20760 [Nocardioides sp.]